MKAAHLHDSHRFLVPAFGGSNPPAPANRILVIWLWYSDLQPKPDTQRLDWASLSLPGFHANCAGFYAMIFSRPGAGWSWTRVEEDRFPRHPSMRFRLVLSLALRHLPWRLCQFLCFKTPDCPSAGRTAKDHREQRFQRSARRAAWQAEFYRADRSRAVARRRQDLQCATAGHAHRYRRLRDRALFVSAAAAPPFGAKVQRPACVP